MTMRLTFCPDPVCGVPAEVLDSHHLPSIEGPVEMVTTQCARRHTFRLPAERLSEDVFVAPVAATPPVARQP
jgi:hypothetical protein